MGNQQESQNNILFENIPNDITLSKRIAGKEQDFIRDIHMSYDYLKETYGLSRDQAKKIKHKVYNIYEKNIPIGFKQLEYSKPHAVSNNGTVINIRRREVIKSSLNHKGYPHVCLENKKTKTVHRIVAETFIPNPENKPQVNHIDGNKQNNDVSNLEWVTNKENMDHAVRIGLRAESDKKISLAMTGSKNHRAKLTEAEAKQIKDLCETNTNKQIAELFPVGPTIVSIIRHNKIWKHIK